MRGISRYRCLVALVGAILLLTIRLLAPVLGDLAGLLAVITTIAGLVVAFGSERWWVVLPPSRRKHGPLKMQDAGSFTKDDFADWITEILARSGGRGLAASRRMNPGIVEGWTADRKRVRAVCLHLAEGGRVQGLPDRDLRLDERFGSTGMVLLVTNGTFAPGLGSVARAQGVTLVDRDVLDAWTRSGAILR